MLVTKIFCFFQCFLSHQTQMITSTPLSLSLLMTTQEAFVDNVDQDQTAQNVQSDF